MDIDDALVKRLLLYVAHKLREERRIEASDEELTHIVARILDEGVPDGGSPFMALAPVAERVIDERYG